MQLERSRSVLRTRKPYEAVDLGVLLLRRLYRPTLWAWLWLIVPIQLGVLFACAPFHGGFSYLALWWFKPLYDRPLGLVLGRGLFGGVPSGRAFLRALWTQGRRGLLADLTYRRFDPARSLVAPVALLEGVRGVVAAKRRHTLVMAGSSSVATLLLACMAIELGCTTGIALGVLMLVPDELPFVLSDLFSMDWDEVFEKVVLGAYALSIGLCEPLYVASGFGLYVDRRTTLEGWDVELAFRSMARRLASAAAAALLLGSVLHAAPAQAQPLDAGVSCAPDAGAAASAPATVDAPASQSAATAEGRLPMPELAEDGQAATALGRVLALPELQREHVEEYWQLREAPDDSAGAESAQGPSSLGLLAKMLADVAALVLWGLAGAAAAWLLYLLVESARRHGAAKFSTRAATVALPVRFEKLPGRALGPLEVVARVHELLAAGEVATALSVLYVGTLTALVLFDAVEVPVQATEGECLRRVSAAPIAPARRDLFAELSERWQLAAYAHVTPDSDQVDVLCQRFAACFGVPA